MNIVIDGKRKKVEAKKLSRLLKELDINPEEFLVVRDGELMTSDDAIREGDILELLSIVSGG